MPRLTRYDAIEVKRDPSLNATHQLRFELQRVAEEVPHYKVFNVLTDGDGWIFLMELKEE